MNSTSPAVANPALAAQVTAAARAAGIEILAAEAATSFAGDPTTRFTLALPETNSPHSTPSTQTLQLELSNSFALDHRDYADQLLVFFAETAQRLRNPVPASFITLLGIPLTYSNFAWPFHHSTAGADTSLVHGEIRLADGPDPVTGQPSVLHARIAAAMTVTFREIVRAPEQPFAESFILNAVRKTMDQGQLELVKSGNRQPVPVTTRFYSPRTEKFVFNDTDEAQRRRFLLAKTFWLSGVLGAPAASPHPDSSSQFGLSPEVALSSQVDLSSRSAAQGSAVVSAPALACAPVWLLDPRDAQYLNATVADLKISVEALAREGMIALAADPAYASPTPALLARRPEFHAELAQALAAIKPTFNESMRSGQTNM